eukprot:TRINITY_DN2897_c0_g1_i1.p1 TRINITY_DN2897_c0_g1~~TRINITY_DN2897_c0_g1_i1.p1  ORF type:complete len:322 (+),score=32.91 TRINITY_DN2897_c0_g1_i1:95-967(+)
MMGVVLSLPTHSRMSALVMERAAGTLHDLLMESDLTMRHSVELALGTARGMAFLHGRRLIHRDLKAQNVLINDYGVPKVSDFGLSRFESSVMDTSVGTPCTMAPEVIRHDPYGLSADVYSFGIVLWQLVTKNPSPYPNMNSAQVVFQVAVAGVRPPIPENVPSELVSLIKECWAQDPEERPAFLQIITRLQSFLSQLPEGEPLAATLRSSGAFSVLGGSSAKKALDSRGVVDMSLGSLAQTSPQSAHDATATSAQGAPASLEPRTGPHESRHILEGPATDSINPDDSANW